ncbi:MAG: ImmA/IrrE family metallo-endopeptidase [Thermodesulfobacteriota bacterium]|nr:ImmA/IrrE family metallo-endopeptidase [Thermodesulfobacteriota bacterium]
MGKALRNQYEPDVVSPPGETLAETIEALGMSQAQLAERIGRSKKMINEIIKGKAPITARVSIELERVVGVPAGFWNNRERHYREFVARKEEKERLEDQVSWLKAVPFQPMAKLGWIESAKDKIERLKEVLKFFGIASPRQWPMLKKAYLGNVAFRKSTAFESDQGALIAWLRQGELEAKKIRCEPYDSRQFRSALARIRQLTAKPPEVFQPELVRLCAACGVAVVFVPELPRTRVSGATRWLTPDKALIQLSLRYKSNDHLWFSFFHEAGHILKHGKRDVFIEGKIPEKGDPKEDEANAFASDILIPKKELSRFLERQRLSKTAIRKFASQLGIAPGIVVGRLQHDEALPQSHCNDLKRRFQWANQAQGEKLGSPVA